MVCPNGSDPVRVASMFSGLIGVGIIELCDYWKLISEDQCFLEGRTRSEIWETESVTDFASRMLSSETS